MKTLYERVKSFHSQVTTLINAGVTDEEPISDELKNACLFIEPEEDDDDQRLMAKLSLLGFVAMGHKDVSIELAVEVQANAEELDRVVELEEKGAQ